MDIVANNRQQKHFQKGLEIKTEQERPKTLTDKIKEKYIQFTQKLKSTYLQYK